MCSFGLSSPLFAACNLTGFVYSGRVDRDIMPFSSTAKYKDHDVGSVDDTRSREYALSLSCSESLSYGFSAGVFPVSVTVTVKHPRCG